MNPLVARSRLALFLLLTGCSSGPEAISERLEMMGPAPFAVRIVLPVLTGTVGETGVRIDLARLERTLRDELARSRACTLFTVVNGEEAGSARLEEQLDADIELRVEAPRPPSQAFSRRTGWFVPNTLLWFFGGFPSFWVADRAYELAWDASLSLRSASTGRELRKIEAVLREERLLNVFERGWTAEVLYTPPGLYEGPGAGDVLALRAEEWLVRRLVDCVKEESLRIPFDVQIEVESVREEVSVRLRSPTVIERLRIEVNGAPVFERDALTMVKARRIRAIGVNGDSYEYSIRLPVRKAPEDQILRVMALRTEDPSAGHEGWSASRTVKLRSGG